MRGRSHLVWAIMIVAAVLAAAACSSAPESASLTTILLARHADRDNGSMSAEGLARAETLAHVAQKAEVTAIYAADEERDWQTAQPLADALGILPSIYHVSGPDLIKEMAAEVLRDHRGEVILVVGHNTTVPLTIEALGGDSSACSIGAAFDEFDNLCILTIPDSGSVRVLNLQYGEPTP